MRNGELLAPLDGVARRFEMAATLKDFQRLLPAVATVEYDRMHNTFSHIEADRRWTLQIINSRKRAIAGLRLSVVDAVFMFTGYEPDETDEVIERFLAYFRRGGG